MGGDADVEITMVSEDNFLLFTPMLPQVASGMIETRHIVMPIRTICDRTTFYEGRVKNIDPYGKSVDLWGTREKRGISITYDFLVLALGSQTNFFGLSDVEKNAYTMKTLGDAVVLRNRVVDMLEQAENETDPILRGTLLTFVIVGGGFAGIETAGEILDLLLDARKHYPNIRKDDFSVVVLEALGAILPGFDEKLAKFAHEKLLEKGMDIRLRTAVSGFDGTEVSFKGLDGGGEDAIRTNTLVWTAGVTPVNTIKRSLFKTEKGKIVVDGFLAVPEFPGVFAVGDCALSVDPGSGRPFPPTAQLAEAQGETVAHNLQALIRGGGMKAFTFKQKGQMAVIGKRTGIASFLGANIAGFWAWFLWRNVYLSKIPRMEKRIRVLLDWTIDLFFDRDIARMKLFRKSSAVEQRGLDEVDDVW
ncbi:NADH dehydrogenase, FAD-containing subunit [Cenarchaeum symbiosum A]|uniref:NADH:ubiquinone reductase (non-electrogenic) n=1 Tax=Cenarchaeum symbiosum (strain A) TaxID=414004 RepID=A0RYN8_CENSY|nr:NADH dehydrogenase, FAD-containing subunit [Cenarchaeum symbiosum A]